MDFVSFMETAWADHAADPGAVAARLPRDGLALARDESDLVRLAGLAHHVQGEHLGRWDDGVAFMRHLEAHPAYRADGESGRAARRCAASLALSANGDAELGALSASDRARVEAMAAANLAERATGRAARLLESAWQGARSEACPDDDPAHRALAVAANNLACSLEEKKDRSAAERDLMTLAAQVAREQWAVAGTWLETERAEYRLAMSWLQAGDPMRARTHAQACLAIVAANTGPALERFFGFEALGRVEHAAGDRAAHAQALAAARDAYAMLDPADHDWCAASLARLAG